ncbi:hypothetical protein CVT24_000405 [Panaeolus cyanescens]|uniref:5'-Nucleotidase C-terminal domain-containing protein n=1 Tax=Panaeolus cyanescens TaxID=181874 RepID=A0A409YDK9_9AGAR|nr:hypothetical protein CVT24_000405 [Panaeolus cyanescens]
MFPKLVALNTDTTIFTAQLHQDVWETGAIATADLLDSIRKVDKFTLADKGKTNVNSDTPRIVTDILSKGSSLAIVSQSNHTNKLLCCFQTVNPKSGETEPMIKLVRYDEVVDEPKSEHFKRIHGWTQYNYTDMVLFDDEVQEHISDLGVVVHKCPTDGLSFETYMKGIAHWTEKQSNDLAPASGLSTKLCIAHFNDVYQVGDQKVKVDGKQETINVTKFAHTLATISGSWSKRQDGKKDGLIVFSGDLFSPSTESSVTRGKHMAPVINGLGVDVACVGGFVSRLDLSQTPDIHFVLQEITNLTLVRRESVTVVHVTHVELGVPQLQKLIKDTSFPWLLSNVVDEKTGKVPDTMAELHVLERAGIRIGFIGLVEREWIATVTGWPENYKWKDMVEVGMELSAVLRDPSGEHKCDFVIAVTHSRIPNDIKIARALGALSPKAQENTDISSLQGVDILLGGHDHIYWISKGVDEWIGYDINSPQEGAEDDQGDTLIVKSGTDFQDLSEVILELKDTPAGSVRRKVIHKVSGNRHVTRQTTPVDEAMKSIIDSELGTINAAMAEPIHITEVQLDVRSSFIRLQESPIGNWIADCIRHAYDEALSKLGYTKTDCVVACCGDFRGDGVYEPGFFTLKNLMTVLPYDDPTIVVELDANGLWDTVESGLSRWPTQEGRFPAVSGMRVTWDSKKPAGSRVLSIWLTEQDPKKPGVPVDKEEVKRSSTRKYLVMVGEYMAQGGDGYDVLKGKKQIIPAENGQSKSALIRKFLLGKSA